MPLGCGSMVCLVHPLLVDQPRVELRHFAVIWLQKDGVLEVRPHIHWRLIGLSLSNLLTQRLFLLHLLLFCLLVHKLLSILCFLNLGLLLHRSLQIKWLRLCSGELLGGSSLEISGCHRGCTQWLRVDRVAFLDSIVLGIMSFLPLKVVEVGIDRSALISTD